MKRIITAGILFIVLVSAGYFYFLSGSRDPIPVEVQTSPVLHGKFIASTLAQGELIARKKQQLITTTVGTISDCGMTAGQFLRAGTVVATVRLLKPDMHKKQEELEYEMLDLDIIKEQVQQSEALLRAKAISEMELKELKIKQYKQEKLVEDTRKEISDDSIKTNINGLLVEKTFNDGDRVNAGTAIATIIDTGSYAVRIKVDQHQISSVHIGQLVEYSSQTFLVARYGKVLEIEREANNNNQNIQSVPGAIEPQFTVLASFNSSHNDNLYIGSFIDSRFILQEKNNTIYIPLEAVLYRYNSTVVFISNKNIASIRYIQTGLSNDRFIEVLSGINANDTVIISGNLDIKDGDLTTSTRINRIHD